MHRKQAGHDRCILFRRPGHHLGFDVIGENGIEHRLLLDGLGRTGCPLKGRSGPDHPDMGAAASASSKTAAGARAWSISAASDFFGKPSGKSPKQMKKARRDGPRRAPT